jgi:hypothetical protein
MKTKLLLLTLSTTLVSLTHAASYRINSGSGVDANGITNSADQAFRSGTILGASLGGANGGLSGGPGVIAVGTFSTDSFDGVSSPASLISLFTNLGSATSTFGSAGPTSNRGLYSLSVSTPIGGSSFAGKNLYLFAGNGATFATSTEFLILKSSSTLSAADDDVATGIDLTFRPSNSTLLLGNNEANVFTTGADTTTTPGWSTAVLVPEPSSILLGAVGALGLLRRRRN